MDSISVVIASYNGEKYIKKQIESILPQLKELDELIVSDDGSIDKTKDIVLEIAKKDSRVRLIDGPKKGYNKNFENAIKEAKNDYIFISDQDDEWLENKVETVMNSFDDKTMCIRHNAVVVDAGGSVLVESYNDYRKANTSYLKNIYKNTFTGCCMCVKRTWLLKLLPFPQDVFYDAWIGILSCKFNCAKVIPDKLMHWCRHEGTVTKLKRNSFLWIIKDRLKLYKLVRKKAKTL